LGLAFEDDKDREVAAVSADFVENIDSSKSSSEDEVEETNLVRGRDMSGV
jgi:hypothetical protein